MNCPKCHDPADADILRKFGGLCPRCLLQFTGEHEPPRFPDLEIVGVIGRGGMGIVYKAVRKSDDRTVAVKVLSPRSQGAPEFVERFTREAEALAQLHHPNIVRIYHSGVHDGVPFLVMEHVEGASLRKRIRTKTLSSEKAVEIAAQVCDALQYAHSRGVIHRDIKPENILVRADGVVKIADFGLAKLTSADQVRLTLSNVAMGTPHYMAPEQLEKSADVDERADLFSLGVVLYEMVTGQLPIGRFKPPSKAGGTDLRLDSIVLDLLERDPEDRVSSAKELRRQLKRLDMRLPLNAPPAEISVKRRDPLAAAAWMATMLVAPVLLSIIGALLRGELSWIANVVFPAGLLLGVAGLFLSALWLFRMRWQPRERESSAQPLAGIVLACGIFVAAGHLRWTDRPFRLDDAWPTTQELPIYVRVYGKHVPCADSLDGLPLIAPHHADLDQVRRLSFCDGRLEVVGIQFRSATARRRWQEAEERARNAGPPRRWSFRHAGGASILLMLDGEEKPDPMIRDLMRKALDAGIGRAVDRESGGLLVQARNR
jgi:hypothetical protein